MSRVSGRRPELVCVLCNDTLADLEKACAGHHSCAKAYANATTAEDHNKNITEESISSERNVSSPDQGRMATPHLGLGGYHPVTNETLKEVVATKCGHMFHQGCLRKHVNKMLVDGKGGSLFCPICIRPFAMNRLWPVIIPATKVQKERYMQLKRMKEQNADMVKQLKEIRTKITEEEARLEQIKLESEECLQDIQQKQKLLDAVNGPTNKEMVELTKLHMKRQEILHVVTQHNADLLKLLAEESNISTTTAEKMINVKTENNNELPTKTSDYKNLYFLSKRSSSHRSTQQVPSSIYNPQTLLAKGKSSKKLKKSGDKSKKKSRKKARRQMQNLMLSTEEASEINLNQPQSPNKLTHRKHPSMVLSHDPQLDSMMKKFPGVLNPGCRTVDTFMKWNMESVKELMSLESFSESSIKDEPTSLNRRNDPHYHHQYGHDRDRQEFTVAQAPKEFSFPKKNSVNFMLGRKPAIFPNKNLFDGLVKK